MRLLIAATVSLLCMSATASADWEFTKWGMTLDQTVVSGKGKVNKLSSEQVKAESTFIGLSCLAQINGPYRVADIVFRKVNLCFDSSGALQSVDLYADGGEFFQVDRVLASAFGSPVSSEGGMIPERIYQDRTKGNVLRLTRITSTVLSYKPVPKGF